MSLQQLISKIVWGDDAIRPSSIPHSAEPEGIKTSPAATFIAVLLVLSLIATGVLGFLSTPAGEQQWQLVQSIIAKNSRLSGGGGTAIPGDFTCPEGIARLEFNERGVLMEPYPTLQPDAQRFCFDLVKYQNFLALKGKTESGREIDGLTWLAETIAFPDWPAMLDQVKAALTDIRIATNMPTVGWIELPGYDGNGTPAPNPPTSDVNPVVPGQTTWEATPTPFQPSEPTVTHEPTDTPMPTLAVADIPTLVVVTPAGGRATQVAQPNFPTQAPAIATKKADAMAEFCADVIDATRFHKLDTAVDWGYVEFLEFRWGEDGLYAQSDRVGGNGPDAFKAKVCVRQILDAPSSYIDYGNGITAEWNWGQARAYPMYGEGDGFTNGMECRLGSMWVFQCTAQYPPEQPTPTPEPPPTATPRATISLNELINLFVQNGWSLQGSCEVNGTSVLIRLGDCGYWDNPSYWVDFSPVWDRYQEGDIYVGPCIQLDDPKMEWEDTGICVHPFQ